MLIGLKNLIEKIKSKKSAEHPFLTGVHKPFNQELCIENLEVQGNIPKELDGIYVRNGPNPVKPPNNSRYHWFLGDGML